MKASYRWICDYLKGNPGDADRVAELLTFSGTEIDLPKSERLADDVIYEAGVTSNRVDSLCHVGLAREVAAVAGLGLAFPETSVRRELKPTSSAIDVTVEDPTLCQRFVAQVIEGVRVGPSPEWLVRRLTSVGIRSINNIVDITNFVMLELNQPLHAYDLTKIRGATIVVRSARPGERLRLINGQVQELVATDVVIADAVGAIGLAGVMGGMDSEVSANTNVILLESASFAALSVRRTARRLGLRSDASHRFERGVDRNGAAVASDRAARLILEVASGRLLSGPLDVGGEAPGRSPISLRLEKIRSVTGVAFDAKDVSRSLTSIECRVASEHPIGTLQVTPPSFRADLFREIDLIEEVIRLAGIHRVPESTGMTVIPVPEHKARALRERLRDRLVSHGYFETLTPDFVADGVPAELSPVSRLGALRARQPVRSGEASLRRSVLPSLLQVRKHNQDQGNDDLHLFETTALKGLDAAKEAASIPVVGMLSDSEFRDVRGVVEDLCAHFGQPVTIAKAVVDGLDRDLSAEVLLDGRRVGVIGGVGREALKAYGLKSKPIYAELELSPFVDGPPRNQRFTALPRFPAVERDLALVVQESTPYADVRRVLACEDLVTLEHVELFDVFRDPAKLGTNKKSLALRLRFRSLEGTLTSEDVDKEIAGILSRFHEKGLGSLRGP